ncbi:alanyl-tRNA editing protein [Pseudothermotoga sp.]|uniref:alanyl-tRNA editing protein n=1 Tax=Pseudothermotoga sp. TaxID=2033661 RepID=UPI000E9A0372|nr:alanyl-tRNA editing protein [Pseudothermotoga sp.]HBJ82167.1 alanyl-tRNA editing protein [Pseudothermotoga sp.]
MIKIKKVREENDKFLAFAEKSPFYPDGKGGQLGDRGKIDTALVLGVEEREGLICHILDAPVEPGEHTFEIDYLRRKDIAIQHSAQHILSASFLRVADIQTLSFHMGEEFSTIDLDVPQITEVVLQEVEEMANEIVRSCIKVEIVETNIESARNLNLRKSLSEKVGEIVRVVKIGDFDLSACAGFHVSNTGEIGIIKIVSWEKVKKTLTRVYFLAGNRALRDYSIRVSVLRELSTLLTSSVSEMPARTRILLEKVKDQAALINRISEEYAKYLSKDLETHKIKGINVSVYNGFDDVARFLPKYFQGDLLICKTSDGYQFSSEKIDCSKLIAFLREKTQGAGGGGTKKGSLKTSAPINKIFSLIDNYLGVI